VTDLRAYVVGPDEGETVRGPVGGPATFKVRGADTGGRFTALVNVIPPHQGPPLHRHHDADEMYYVLEGAVRYRTGDEHRAAETGSFIWIPRGMPHCFRNDSDAEPARLLVMFNPAGMERFFEGLAALPAGPVAPEVFAQVAAGAEMEVLGPPLGPLT
jgi:quercetin dioxygenase-like cupin family protein